MSPFQDSINGGGFYTPVEGTMAIGRFLGTEDGPVLTFKEKDGTEKVTKNMRWKWLLFNMDGTPLMYAPPAPDGTPGTEQQHAEVDALSTEATGPKAKARKWVEAHLRRKVEGPVTGAEFTAMIAEAAKAEAKVYLVFGKNSNDKIGVANVLPVPVV
jgi:hypothetical protein